MTADGDVPLVSGQQERPTIWLNTDDLFEFAKHHSRPTGIQRVVYEICRALSAREEVVFIRRNSDDFFIAVEWQDIESLFDRRPRQQSATILAPKPIWRRMALWLVHHLLPHLRHMIFATVEKRRRRHSISAYVASTTTLRKTLGNLSTQEGDTFVSLGAPWIRHDDQLPLDEIRERGLRLAVMFYDIIPIRRPEWFSEESAANFSDWFYRTLPRADVLLAISKATAEDIERQARECRISLRSRVIPIPLGTGFNRNDTPLIRTSRLPFAGTYALIVSTIEVRKNHAILFRVWRRLLDDLPPDQVPTLVFAGRVGWLVSDLMQQIKNSHYLGGKLIVIEDASDAELACLYDGCLFTLFPSLYEGWGLPVTESLAFGRPCIVSHATSIPEAGGDLALYIDPDNTTEAYRLIRSLIEEPTKLMEWRRRIENEFRPRDWSHAAREVMQAIQPETKPLTREMKINDGYTG